MKRVWGLFWTIVSLIGGYALWCTFQLPSESRNAFLWGMSKSKLALCAGMALAVLLCLTAAVLSFLNKDNAFSSGKAAGISAYILTFSLILGWIFLTPPVGKTATERSLLERLTPLMCWGLAFSILAFFFLLGQKWKLVLRALKQSAGALLWGFAVLLLMGGALFYALKSGTGLDPISGTFYRQGVSLLEGHLIVPLLFAFPLIPLFSFAGPKISGKKTEKILTILTVILGWTATVWLWQTTQFEGRSYFAPALRAPNNNFYPASDAENYDLLAQSILLGNGFRNGLTVVRPLYAAFLALLHLVFGNNYMAVTNGQILLLAFIPLLVFLTGKQLGQTPAGIVAAAWVIWREIYSIRLSPLVQVSNSRLLMSDLPTLFCVVLTIFCTVKWYRHGKEYSRALLCGGMIGAAMLIRTQCFVLIPALWLIMLCSRKDASKKWLSILCSVIGLVIVFAPWTVWNKINPNTVSNPDVSEGQYLNHLYQEAAGETDPNVEIVQVIMVHPAEVFQSVGSHFLNNEISSLLVLPVRLIKPTEVDQLFYEPDLFWYRENARQTIEENKTLIAVYLVIISLGVFTACRKNGFGGLIPLVFHVVYNLGNAFAMTSGFRFLLPVDWVMLIYFAFGCCGLIRFVCKVCLFRFDKPQVLPETTAGLEFIPETAENEAVPDLPAVSNHQPVRKTRQGWAAAGIVLLLAAIGAVLPLCDNVIPRRFAHKTGEEIAQQWRASSNPSALDLSRYKDETIVFLEGRAFYPRFYKAGEGDSGGSSSAKCGLDIDRLVWMFHDDSVHVLCCPLTEDQIRTLTPQSDPMDVMVVGIQRDDFVEVLEMRQLFY
ncbi:MAG: glycosyltransferase family 39 protein [Anaerolineaceae bacterium]|nr:glycosyltransferase family 39 protein [Anaerolineaceae bacterium]